MYTYLHNKVKNLSGSGIHAHRVLKKRGLRQFVRDGVTSATENVFAPLVTGWFQRRTLDEEALRSIARLDDLFFEYYDDPETFSLSLPTTPSGYTPTERERMAATYASEISIGAPYVCELRGVDLVGPNALPVSTDGFVFENALQSERRLSTGGLLALGHGQPPIKNRALRSDRRVDVALSLVGPWNYNYTHWFQDYLGRLEGLEHYRDQTGIDPKLIVPADAADWMLDALRAMGYGPDRWIPYSDGRVSVDTLVVAGVRREDRKRNPKRRLLYSPTEFQWLRDRILDNIESVRTRPHEPRIFISRENATVRRLVNDDEVLTLLSEWGFERYRPETMSFAEQVTLFSKADAIVSTHGSGLLNQIWADDATVIEMFGPKHSVTDPAIEYYTADLLGHEYGCVQGEAVGVDTRVDVEDLKVLLETMLSS